MVLYCSFAVFASFIFDKLQNPALCRLRNGYLLNIMIVYSYDTADCFYEADVLRTRWFYGISVN